MLEAYTTLGFLAAQTERVRLGTMVSPVALRPPALLVKAVTTLGVLSGGRAWLGIGAGYHSAEAEALGLPLPPVAERFERLEQTLQVATRMWAGDETPFEGKHYRLGHPVDSPGPAQRPHPPILVGGAGARCTLRLVARYADACSLADIPDGGRTVTHPVVTCPVGSAALHAGVAILLKIYPHCIDGQAEARASRARPHGRGTAPGDRRPHRRAAAVPRTDQ